MGDWVTDVIFNEDVFILYVIGSNVGRYNERWPKKYLDQLCKSDRPDVVLKLCTFIREAPSLSLG